MQERTSLFMLIATLIACAACTAPEPAAEPAPLAHAARVPARAGIDASDTRLLAEPAAGARHVAFVYAADIWVADIGGGPARRLTTHPGRESRPRISPDGGWIAFSGEYDGNTDVYRVAIAGGEPQRLTWHPGADLVVGFTPDGREVLFTSQRAVYTSRFAHLFRIAVDGGVATRIPLPTCFDASMSSDGKKLAYCPLPDASTQWKNYRGGTASRIWIYDLADRSVVQVPQPDGRCNDTDPMWVGSAVYFRSDRAGEFNLFSYDPASKAVEQRTRHADFPVIDASAGGGRIVYEQAGFLHAFDPASSSSARLAIGVAADLLETRPRFVESVEHVRSADLSPSGSRAVFGIRGEIVTVPAEKGDARNLTNTPGANERTPVWSPDGKSIAYFSDAGGENRLVVAPQDGRGDARTFDLGGAGFYTSPSFAPDGKKLAFLDNSRALYWIDLEGGAAQRVDQEPVYGVLDSLKHAWSPDSKWIAYTRMERSNFKRVYLHELASGATHAITDGLADAAEPVFDAAGKFLYLAASTDAGPFNAWFSQASADVEETNALYAVVLSKDEASPFAKESDEEEPKAENGDEEEPGDAGAQDEAPEPGGEKEGPDATPDVRIDLDRLAQRIVALPLAGAFYSKLAPGAAGQLFYLKAERAPFAGAPPKPALCRFDLEDREEKVLLEGAQDFVLSRDREKLLVRTEAGWWIAGAKGDKVDVSKGKLALDSVRIRIDPRAEWAQIYDEVWRINRDWFYDPGMHGADWSAMKARYAQFLPHLACRSDLNRVIRWLCSELAVGHSYSGGGDTLVEADKVPGGLLGADYEVAEGRYRFSKVYGGLNWTPDLRAPLTEPGVAVEAGEYLLAVDGRDLRAPDNLYARFENTAGKLVEITVGPSSDGSGSRTAKVVPIESEQALRNRDWVEGNIRKVTEATDGRVAYVYVPDTAETGWAYFKRYFFPQAGRDGIIVDERHNGGGSIADYYIDILRRPYVAHWAMRYGEDLVTPQAAVYGPKVMLIDETAGSGGDLLPWMFKRFGMGKLIGRPTWGGLVGILGFPELMDGGFVTAPNVAIWTEDEGFTVENVGVPPDIEVEQLPASVEAGRDPQLEKAIEVVLDELERSPPRAASRPPFPVRARR